MSQLKSILQWVTISDEDDETKVSHQFDEDGTQKNIKYMLNLSEQNKLNVLIAIPVEQRIGNKDNPVGNPFIAIDMKTGMINVNGTNWNFVPHGIDTLSVKFRPIWYHSVRKDFSADSMTMLGEKITLYKVGWQFTHEEKNYQRIVFYNVETGIFSLKEKR